MSKCDNCRLREESARAFDIHWHGQEDCPYDVCPEIKTNGDRLRTIDDIELAKELAAISGYEGNPEQVEYFKWWLKQEAEDG